MHALYVNQKPRRNHRLEGDIMRKVFATTIATVAMVATLLVGTACSQQSKIEAKPMDQTEWTLIGEFDMEGRNATPFKEVTIDKDFIEVEVKYEAKDEVLFLAEVYYLNGDNQKDEIPMARVLPLAKSGETVLRCPVKKGTKFQILTQAYQPDGTYNDDYLVDKVSLSYRLTD